MQFINNKCLSFLFTMGSWMQISTWYTHIFFACIWIQGEWAVLWLSNNLGVGCWGTCSPFFAIYSWAQARKSSPWIPPATFTTFQELGRGGGALREKCLFSPLSYLLPPPSVKHTNVILAVFICEENLFCSEWHLCWLSLQPFHCLCLLWWLYFFRAEAVHPIWEEEYFIGLTIW